ncbi:hypothetical protein [Umezawaea sp. Da 62-37]|uniref:hypothetical protein n=1 Tax=Umezawaea sp. Da 62-37 TaxID=3075927 RepID=UPI0028F6C3D0|nr:hypothetical protein [Umezawaea sp. Da 62-37]WNV84404.1 hypothetical protein RM788_40580 [Umezawaea sp. Da 62-37]
MSRRGDLPSTGRPRLPKALITLAVVFLVLAVWNGWLAVGDSALWRSVTAASCLVCAAALTLIAVNDGRS